MLDIPIRQLIIPDRELKYADIEIAKEFAYDAYRDSPRRKTSGNEYYTHAFAVAKDVLESCKNEDYLIEKTIAAILHDVIEENSNIQPEVLERLFGNYVTFIVLQLSDDIYKKMFYKKVYYQMFKLQYITNESMTIKWKDRKDNTSDILKLPRQKAYDYTKDTHELIRYAQRYRKLSDVDRATLDDIEHYLEPIDFELGIKPYGIADHNTLTLTKYRGIK